MIEIDADRAIALLREVVKGNEGRVYEKRPQGGGLAACRYEFDGECDCIVGRALHAAGVPIERLSQLDRCPASGIDCVWPYLKDIVEFGPGAIGIFSTAQTLQDRGSQWGRALEAAESYHSNTQSGMEKVSA